MALNRLDADLQALIRLMASIATVCLGFVATDAMNDHCKGVPVEALEGSCQLCLALLQMRHTLLGVPA